MVKMFWYDIRCTSLTFLSCFLLGKVGLGYIRVQHSVCDFPRCNFRQGSSNTYFLFGFSRSAWLLGLVLSPFDTRAIVARILPFVFIIAI